MAENKIELRTLHFTLYWDEYQQLVKTLNRLSVENEFSVDEEALNEDFVCIPQTVNLGFVQLHNVNKGSIKCNASCPGDYKPIIKDGNIYPPTRVNIELRWCECIEGSTEDNTLCGLVDRQLPSRSSSQTRLDRDEVQSTGC